MSPPVAEIITFPASDALKADPSFFTESKFTQLIAEKTMAAGMMGQAWGFRTEEPETWQGFINWPTLEHHKEISPTLVKDQEIGQVLQRIAATRPTDIHVPFTPFDNYKRAIAAPVAEVVFTSIKDGADPQEFKDAVENGLETAGAAEGCIRGAWGFTIEDEKAAVMIMGWESSEAHQKYEGSQAVKDTIGQFLKVGNIEKAFHVRLTYA